ncbi:glycosyltransferase family 4 protein [Marinobacter adhaerens]|uniref:glycosyltransferase family 4 protein n=1 Tax=Marinobacter adhaerens TaxID=1033846 RepID=UPI001C599B05|nr:glycosyltransferase family 4 protein [Marinobacter adhaerens]MBW3225632.1 glycosyltransferase family 4 protein [Marinobacter adhaerens]
MKTILHLIDTTGPGGAETVFINLLRELEQTDFRNVVVLRGQGWVADQVRGLGITPLFIDSKGSFNLGYIRILRRLLRDEQVDLIHGHLLGSNVYGALLAMICRKPMIATFHGAVDVASGERFLRAKFFIIGWGASAIVCVSKRLQEELRERSPLPADKLELIYNGVDPELFCMAQAMGLREVLGLPPEAKLVVSIGNIRPAKGYEHLVDAAVAMAARDSLVHFVVVGHQRASLFEKLEAQIAKAPEQPNIHWLGFRQDVVTILRQADIFLLPSTSEGFSISTVEAMMAGVPIIATRSGGPEEIVADGKTGILIPTRDPNAIADAIERLGDSALRDTLTAKARAEALQRFSLASMLRSYKRLYERLIRW